MMLHLSYILATRSLQPFDSGALIFVRTFHDLIRLWNWRIQEAEDYDVEEIKKMKKSRRWSFMCCGRECETYLQVHIQFNRPSSPRTHWKSVPESTLQPYLHTHMSLPDKPKVSLNRRSFPCPWDEEHERVVSCFNHWVSVYSNVVWIFSTKYCVYISLKKKIMWKI